MIAEQSTKTEPATQADELAAAPSTTETATQKEGQAETSLSPNPYRNDLSPAEHEWTCIHQSLRERMAGPVVKAYLENLPILGGQDNGWRIVLSARGEDADPGRRSFLLRRTLNDIQAGGPNALPAIYVIELLMWFELDTLFWRSLRVVPQHAALGIDIIDAFAVAIERLPHRLEHAIEDQEGELDVGKELTALTTYLVEKLVEEQHQQVESPSTEQSSTPVASADPRLGEHFGRGELISGLFTRAELPRLLDEDHLFRFRVVDTSSRGKALIRAIRYPILRSV